MPVLKPGPPELVNLLQHAHNVAAISSPCPWRPESEPHSPKPDASATRAPPYVVMHRAAMPPTATPAVMHVARDQDVDKIEDMAYPHPGRGPDAGMPTQEMPAASGAAPVRPISSGCALPSPISRASPSFRRRPAPIPRTIPTAVGCTAALDPSSTHTPTVGKDAHCATADGRP